MSFLPIGEENQQAPAGQTTNTPGQGTTTPPPQSGGSTGGGQAGGTPVGASNGSSTQFGSSASKLGDYLTANAPQIQGQADKVTSGLNTQYQGLQNEIGQGATGFGQQVAGGYAAPNQGAVDQAVANPTGFASNAQNVKDFQGQYNDQYTGPQNYEGTTPYSQIQGDVSNAVQGAGLLNSQAGLQSYLAGTQGGNQTQASNTLDTLLLQGNPGAQQQIQQAAGQFGGLTGQLANSVTAGDQAVQSAQQSAQNAQQYAQGQFNPAVTAFGNTINQGAQTAEANRGTYNTNLNQYLAQTTPLQQQASQFTGQVPYFNFDNVSNPYSTQNQITNPITAANYSTPQQYAEAAALQQLGGAGTQVPLNQANIGQAGQAPNIPTLSGLGGSGMAQEYANDIYNQVVGGYPAHPTMDFSGNKIQSYNNFMAYLQGVNPNAVTGNMTDVGGYGAVYNPVGA